MYMYVIFTNVQLVCSTPICSKDNYKCAIINTLFLYLMEIDNGIRSYDDVMSSCTYATINYHQTPSTITRHPQPSTITRHPQPSTITRHPQPSTITRHPQPSTITRHPQPSTITRHPQPSTITRHPQPSTITRHPQPSTITRHPQPSTITRHPHLMLSNLTLHFPKPITTPTNSSVSVSHGSCFLSCLDQHLLCFHSFLPLSSGQLLYTRHTKRTIPFQSAEERIIYFLHNRVHACTCCKCMVCSG